MPLVNRPTLKTYFSKGKFPKEAHFSTFIDSTVNKIDDGFAKTENDGLLLAPLGNSDRLISFLKSIKDTALWRFCLKSSGLVTGLSLEDVSVSDKDEKETSKSILYFRKGGNIGVHNEEPVHALDVNGRLGINTRIGTYCVGQIPGDGQWHDIIPLQKGITSFEVMASIKGPPKRGKYAMTHAIALGVHGNNSRGHINKTRAYFGFFWNRINIRWRGDKNKYCLQMKTWSHYGYQSDDSENNRTPFYIKYHVTNLWDDNMDFPLNRPKSIDNL